MYAATVQSFIVPMELIPQVSNESWLQRNATEFEQLAQRSLIQVGRKYTGRWQLSCATINATVQVRVLLSVDEGFELEAFNSFANVRLGVAQAAQLHQEMRALFEKYDGRARTEGESKSYLIRYLLVEAQLE